jgi:hypothetical protein
MITVSNSLLAVLLLAVTLALFLGLANMLRGGSPDRSQMLMRWRVGLQLAAVLLMVGAFYLRK